MSLHQHLRKCFHVLEQNQKIWNTVLAECSPLISSLGNLAEQLRALKNVEIASTPLRRFPNLQGRLDFKLSQAVDTVMSKLSEKLDALQAVRDTVSRQVLTSFQLYEQQTDTLNVACCVSRTATTPSVAEMLQWLQDAERYYRLQQRQKVAKKHIVIKKGQKPTWTRVRVCLSPALRKEGYSIAVELCNKKLFHQRFFKRQYLLQIVKPNDLTLLEMVPKRWESLNSPRAEERITDSLLHVCYFMEPE